MVEVQDQRPPNAPGGFDRAAGRGRRGGRGCHPRGGRTTPSGGNVHGDRRGDPCADRLPLLLPSARTVERPPEGAAVGRLACCARPVHEFGELGDLGGPGSTSLSDVVPLGPGVARVRRAAPARPRLLHGLEPDPDGRSRVVVAVVVVPDVRGAVDGARRRLVVLVSAPSSRSGRHPGRRSSGGSGRWRSSSSARRAVGPDLCGGRRARGLPRLPRDAEVARHVRAYTAVLPDRATVAPDVLQRRGAESRTGRSRRWGRGLQRRRVPGVQRRRRPSCPWAALRPVGLPRQGAAGGAVASGGLRHLRRRHLDDGRDVDLRPASDQRRFVGAGAVPDREAEHDRARRRGSHDPDVLHRGDAAQRRVRGCGRITGLLPRRGPQGGWRGLDQGADPAG